MKKIFWITPLYYSLSQAAIKELGILIPALLKQDIELIHVFYADYQDSVRVVELKNLKQDVVKLCAEYMGEIAKIVDRTFGNGSFCTTHMEYVQSSAIWLPAYDYEHEDYRKALDISEILKKLDEIIGDPSDDVKVINNFYYTSNRNWKFSHSFDFGLSNAIHNHVLNERKGRCITVTIYASHYMAKEWTQEYNKEYSKSTLPGNFEFVSIEDIIFAFENAKRLSKVDQIMDSILTF